MIKTFKDRETEKVRDGEFSKKLPNDIQRIARRKLRMLENAQNITDLRAPPSNNLEKLKGTRKEEHSVRINDQWRICFIWKGNNAYKVSIEDYH